MQVSFSTFKPPDQQWLFISPSECNDQPNLELPRAWEPPNSSRIALDSVGKVFQSCLTCQNQGKFYPY